MTKLYILNSHLIPHYNLSWPAHARSRLLTSLSCGHIVYDLPTHCPLCHQEVGEQNLWHWAEALYKRYGRDFSPSATAMPVEGHKPMKGEHTMFKERTPRVTLNEIAEAFLPYVAGRIGAPVDELSATRIFEVENAVSATIYWQAWYVCEAVAVGGWLTLHSWPKRWQHIGLIQLPLHPIDDPSRRREPAHRKFAQQVGAIEAMMTQAAMDKYNRLYNNSLYAAATAYEVMYDQSVRSNLLLNEAMALCGHPRFALTDTDWTDAELEFLAQFTD